MFHHPRYDAAMRQRCIILIAILGSILFASSAHAARDAFAGTWKVILSPDEDAARAGEKEAKDTFTFRGSLFKSKTFEARGYKEAEFEDDTRAGLVATFKAKVKSEKDGGTAVWTGTSTGQDITGELTWTKKDGTELKYAFKGTREAKKE